MINENQMQTLLEFGTGDIAISNGYSIKNNHFRSLLTFSNQSPRNIGDISDISGGEELQLKDFPVAMIFNKVESIDVLIEALLEAKEMILEYNNESDD